MEVRGVTLSGIGNNYGAGYLSLDWSNRMGEDLWSKGGMENRADAENAGETKNVAGNDDGLTPEDAKKEISGHRSSPAECKTCKNRKYQDGSNEMVSFKAAGHINPGNAASVVMSHEQEHVSNAYQKAREGNGEVVRASVRLKTDVCPECGRTFISGGVTNTQIRYYNEGNPYQKDMKESDADNKYRGANVDAEF